MTPILTLTLNPAIDLSWDANGLNPGHKTRIFHQRQDAGGGGINVARVIQRLGGTALALATAGGVTGQWLAAMLAREGITHQLLPISGETRVCTTIHDRAGGEEYRFVPAGPTLSADECQAVLAALAAQRFAWLVVSGSLPPGAPEDFYAALLAQAGAGGAALVLDSSGPALTAALQAAGPANPIALIKPSLSELTHLAGRPLPDRPAQARAAAGLVSAGKASRVAVSLGADGALLADATGVVHLPAAEVTVRSTVGAGDSFAAGLVLALARGEDDAAALRLAVACGSAAAESEGTAQPDPARVAALLAAMPAPTAVTPA